MNIIHRARHALTRLFGRDAPEDSTTPTALAADIEDAAPATAPEETLVTSAAVWPPKSVPG